MLLLRTPLIRRAGVIALAVILSGLALARHRTPLQTVTVSNGLQTHRFLVAADSQQLDPLRARIARQTTGKRTPKPDAYYGAKWRMQAAAHYLALAEARSATSRRPAAPPPLGMGSVQQAAFRETVGLEETKAVEHWSQQHAAARVAFETLAASLPAGPSAAGQEVTLRLGPLVASAAKPAELLALLALASLIAGGYLLAMQPQPGKILLHTRRQIVVPAAWLAQVRDRREQFAKRLYQAACGIGVLAVLVWFW